MRVRTFAERVLELTADDGDEVLKVEEGEALLHDHAAPGHQVARLLEGHLRVCAFEGGGERRACKRKFTSLTERARYSVGGQTIHLIGVPCRRLCE